MEKCIQCGSTLPAHATVCPDCGDKVLSGTVATQSDTVTSKQQITAASPEGNGTVQVMVTTPQGISAPSNADRFTYMPIPMVTDVSPRVAQAVPRIGSGPGPTPIMMVMNVSPNTGTVAGGTLVVITGAGFTGAIQVLFGTTPATSFRVLSDNLIVALSPASSVGSSMVQVIVISPGTLPANQFTYKPAQPVIGGISPNTGPGAGGTLVKITGQFFTGATQVLFETVPTSSFTLLSDNLIVALSPAGSGTVDVRVTTPGGTSATSTADRFTYLKPPVANAGADQMVTVGSTVTLDGSGSLDPGGQPLTYLWTQIAGPTVTLSESTAVKPTFTAPASATVLTFQLVVSNGQTTSSPDYITITVIQSP